MRFVFIIAIFFIVILAVFSNNIHAASASPNPLSEITVTAERYAKVPVVLAIITAGMAQQKKNKLEKKNSTIKKNLTIEQQFDVELLRLAQIPSKKHMKKLANQGKLLLLALTAGDTPDTITWELYDIPEAQLLGHYSRQKKGNVVRGWAHNIADDMW